MDKPIARTAPALAIVAATLLLAACGNKGPLVHATPEPPVVPMEADAGATLPDTVDETTPPPAADDDGG